MPVCSIRASSCTSGSSTSVSSRDPPARSSSPSKRRRQVDHRAGVEHRRGGGVGRAVVEQGALVAVGLSLELAAQVAQGQVGQVVGALVGTGEVRRERGVAHDPREHPPVRGERELGPLGVVEDLRAGRVGEPARRAPSRRRDRGRPRRRTPPARRPPRTRCRRSRPCRRPRCRGRGGRPPGRRARRGTPRPHRRRGCGRPARSRLPRSAPRRRASRWCGCAARRGTRARRRA